MEFALWNGKKISAMQIAEDYKLEKEVREASRRQKLTCPDPECKQNILRYCHGDIKGPYFAHRNEADCDYARFDRQSTDEIRNVCTELFKHFINLGYKVRMEEKVLPHHYTHLLIALENNQRLAIEIGSNKTEKHYVERLAEAYRKENIHLCWIVVGETNKRIEEKQISFLKRHQLNETRNKELIIINKDSREITQYRLDTNKYIFNGSEIKSKNYPQIFFESADIESLILKDNELQIKGFDESFTYWHEKKNKAFQKKLMDNREQSERVKEFNRQFNEKMEELNSGNIHSPLPESKDKEYTMAGSKKEYRAGIMSRMNQVEEPVWDPDRNRWIRCEICGKIDTSDKFSTYGGPQKATLGICRNCIKK